MVHVYNFYFNTQLENLLTYFNKYGKIIFKK